jgi:hypothetical protein
VLSNIRKDPDGNPEPGTGQPWSFGRRLVVDDDRAVESPDQHEDPEDEHAQARPQVDVRARGARLFDIRRLIGPLFVLIVSGRDGAFSPNGHFQTRGLPRAEWRPSGTLAA